MASIFLARLRQHAESSPRTALIDSEGERSFAELHRNAHYAAHLLKNGAPSLNGRRIALFASPSALWLESFFGILAAGGIAVPLSPLYPNAELCWFMDNAGADTLICSPDLKERAETLINASRRLFTTPELEAPNALFQPESESPIHEDDTAMLLYTSGTTGKPKGAMITHKNIAAQASLVSHAWGVTASDTLLHALPLHHLHGLGISLLTALFAGARVHMLPRFDAHRVWNEFRSGRHSIWMAVPTMYKKLFDAFDAMDEASQKQAAQAARALRLATSGSAALPITLAERWRSLTGSIPLERFGMTEIGVGLSNPLNTSERRPGYVGLPLPTVEIKLIQEDGQESPHGPAELYVRGPGVFKAYFERDDATREAFTEDGFFKTGDMGERAPDGYIRLLGRTSIDILKSGGYKCSALEIEESLRENSAIAEVAVVGIPDPTWGERIVAAIVAAPSKSADCTAEKLKAWAKERMAPYKVPRDFLLMNELPRNALGKVLKPELSKEIARKASNGVLESGS